MAIKKALNRKMCPRYLGPLIIISRNQGGTYIVSELDGSVFHRPVAAFRVIPYFACTKIEILPLEELIDISTQQLQELRDSKAADPDSKDNNDDVNLLADD